MKKLKSNMKKSKQPPVVVFSSGNLDADERILEAATILFLAQGFGRTTLDQVAEHAIVGKSSLYNRYKDKSSLFSKVVSKSISQFLNNFKNIPLDLNLHEKFNFAGNELVRSTLLPRCISFIRITAAEAENFPDLAKAAYKESYEGSVKYIANAIADSRFTKAEANSLAERFVKLAIQPITFQAVFGENKSKLLKRSLQQNEEVIDYLLNKSLKK